MGAKMGALPSILLRPPSPYFFFLKPAYSLLFGRSDTSALRACMAVFLPPLTPRISGFSFEKSLCFRFRNNFCVLGSNTNCLVLRRDWKLAALCEFEAIGRKACPREGGPGQNFRQEIDAGRISPSPFFSSQNPFIRCCSVGQIPPRYRACKAVFLPPLTPRISGLSFEKSPRFRFPGSIKLLSNKKGTPPPRI